MSFELFFNMSKDGNFLDICWWVRYYLKGDNIKAFNLIKRLIVKNWSFISLGKFRKLQHLLCFFDFRWPNNSLKMCLALSNHQKYPRYPLVLDFNVTLARPLRLVIPYILMEILVICSALVFSWQQMKLEIWCGWAHPYKTIAKLIVHSTILELNVSLYIKFSKHDVYWKFELLKQLSSFFSIVLGEF